MKVTTIRNRPKAGRYLRSKEDTVLAGKSPLSMPPSYNMIWSDTSRTSGSWKSNIRLDWVGHRVQPVLNLAGLFSDRIQGARIVNGISSPRTLEGVLMAEIVSRSAPDLRHGGIIWGLLVYWFLLLRIENQKRAEGRWMTPGIVGNPDPRQWRKEKQTINGQTGRLEEQETKRKREKRDQSYRELVKFEKKRIV